MATPNYKLVQYAATDAPDLTAGYNTSMSIIDTELKKQSDRINAIPKPPALPAGLSAFCAALGLTDSNANKLGATLNHLLNRTAATTNGQFTVDNLKNTKVTAEGLPFVPAPTPTTGA